MKTMVAHPWPDAPPRRSDAVTLLIAVVLIALPLRLYVATNAEMISRDGAVFIWYAQGLKHDPLAELRNQKQHPFYPAMVLAVHELLAASQHALGIKTPDPARTWIASAVTVSLAGGLAVVVAAYFLGRVLFNRRVGLITALLAAVAAEFCQLSGDALTDMPHLALYLFSIVCAITGLAARRYGWLFLAGLLCGVAYLIRPEGAEIAVVAAGGALMIGRRTSLKHRLAPALIVCLGAALVASPYMAVTGKLVPKKSVRQLFWGESQSVNLKTSFGDSSGTPILAASLPSDFGKAWGRIAENWGRSLRVTLLLPAVLWLIVRRRLPCEPLGARLVAGAMVLHLVILTALIVHFDYLRLFSLRHVMVLAGLTLPFSAAGFAVILDGVSVHRRYVTMLALSAGLVGPTLPWMLETRFADSAHLRRAGEWIRDHDDHVPRVMSTRFRVALYADAEPIWCPTESDPAWILIEARLRRPTWLVFETGPRLSQAQACIDRLPTLTVAGERLERAHDVVGPGPRHNTAVIFRYHPPP